MLKTLIITAVVLTGVARATYPNEQWDWSGGPGVTGPVYWWDDAFDSCEGIDWSDTPGFLYLDEAVDPSPADFVESGCLTSSILEIPMGTDWEVDWGDIHWVSYEPDNTSICFQLRVGYDWENMLAWGDTIFISGTPLSTLLPNDVFYIQYRAILTTSNPLVTPVLDIVTIEGWYPGSISSESSSLSPGQPLLVSPNPSFDGEMTVVIRVSIPGQIELRVYDSTGRLIVVPLSGIQPSEPVVTSVSGLPAGLYHFLLVMPSGSASIRAVVLDSP
jgi:hypothetical protein